MTRKTLILLAFTLLVVSAACGGGSSGVAGASGGSSNLAASFVPDITSPGAETVAFAEAATSGNLVTVQVNVTDTNNVHTAAFDVVFDAGSVEFVGHSAGSFLEQGGNSPVYQVGSSAGRIVVGVSRGGSSGADASGSANLMSLVFRATSAGQSQVSVVNATLRDGNLDDIPNVDWFGGSMVAN